MNRSDDKDIPLGDLAIDDAQVSRLASHPISNHRTIF